MGRYMLASFPSPIIDRRLHYILQAVQFDVLLHERQHRLLIRNVEDFAWSAPHSNGESASEEVSSSLVRFPCYGCNYPTRPPPAPNSTLLTVSSRSSVCMEPTLNNRVARQAHMEESFNSSRFLRRRYFASIPKQTAVKQYVSFLDGKMSRL